MPFEKTWLTGVKFFKSNNAENNQNLDLPVPSPVFSLSYNCIKSLGTFTTSEYFGGLRMCVK